LIFDHQFNKLFSDTLISVLKILKNKMQDSVFKNDRDFIILTDYLLKVYRFHEVFIPSNDLYINFERYHEKMSGEKEEKLSFLLEAKLVKALDKVDKLRKAQENLVRN